MSAENKVASNRPVSEIQTEYQGLCTKVGHIQYQIFVLSKDLALLNETLRDLNVEAARSQAAAQDAKVEAPSV